MSGVGNGFFEIIIQFVMSNLPKKYVPTLKLEHLIVIGRVSCTTINSQFPNTIVLKFIKIVKKLFIMRYIFLFSSIFRNFPPDRER